MHKHVLITLAVVALVVGGLAGIVHAATRNVSCPGTVTDTSTTYTVNVSCQFPKPPRATSTVTATATATVTATVTASPTPTPTSSGSPSPTATSTPTATPPPPAGSNVCTEANAFVNYASAKYVWDDWSQGSISGTGIVDYFADAGLWNSGAPYNVKQHSVFCDHDSWYAVVTDNDAQHDGAVKNYPNTHLDYMNWANSTMPSISDVNGDGTTDTLTSRFAHLDSGPGSYNWSYDIWLNGVGWNGTNTEVMIWTDYRNRTPWSRSVVKNITVDGRQWNLWQEDGGGPGFQFLPADGQPIRSGTFNLSAFFDVLIARGFITATAKLGQVDYGVETVSTFDMPVRFDVTDFSVSPEAADYYH